MLVNTVGSAAKVFKEWGPPPRRVEKVAKYRHIVLRCRLVGLKQAAELIPNQAMLINTLPVLEAQASSAIENIVTTADKLFANLHAEGRTNPPTKEALRYRNSLMEGFQALKRYPISTRMAEAIYPPEGEDVIRRHLAGWERLLHEQRELDPLIRMAARHFQFEAIHPFTGFLA